MSLNPSRASDDWVRAVKTTSEVEVGSATSAKRFHIEPLTVHCCQQLILLSSQTPKLSLCNGRESFSPAAASMLGVCLCNAHALQYYAEIMQYFVLCSSECRMVLPQNISF